MDYLEMDDIIYSIQKFGGASTYWRELSIHLKNFVPGTIKHSNSSKYTRLYSPKSSASLFHSSHFRVSSSPAIKNITTIHDLTYEKGLAGGLGKLLNLYERRKSIKFADSIICISESTRNDLYQVYGDIVKSKPVHVIYHGCSERSEIHSIKSVSIFNNPATKHLQLQSGEFFMFVGGRSGYKNFDLLLNTFNSGGFRERGLKVICTGHHFNKNEISVIRKLGLENSMFDIGVVDSYGLGELYRASRGLIYPSTYEGFGLPPLEAMAAGCPVICANSSSLPEVVGDAGILIDPKSSAELARSMHLLLIEDTRRRYISTGLERAKRFDWRETARRHADVYQQLVPF